MKREEVLKTAMDLVTKVRAQDYGNGSDTLDLSAEFIDTYLTRLDRPMMASDVAMINILQKIARSVHGYKEDNAIDIAGYAALYGELRAEENIEFEEFEDMMSLNKIVEPSGPSASVGDPSDKVVHLKPAESK